MKKIRSLSFDAKAIKGKFKPSTAAEKEFYKSLRRVAQISGHIVDTHTHGDLDLALKNSKSMQEELERYSKKLGPWAAKQSAKLLNQVQNSNKRAYENASKAMGKAINEGVGESYIGAMARALMDEQVGLIQSIPIEAGRRAQKLALDNVLHGTRAQVDDDTVQELKDQLGASTEVAISRAKLIAITETARANASFTQARATAAGAARYIWRATMDEATRPSHRKMNGKIINYDDPPKLEDGTKGHAGTFPRCRCYQEPVFDD